MADMEEANPQPGQSPEATANPTQPITPPMDTAASPSPAEHEPQSNHGLGDSLSIAGLAIAVLTWALAPNFWAKAIAVVFGATTLVYLCYRSHFVENWPRNARHSTAIVVIATVSIFAWHQLSRQWRDEHPLVASVASQTLQPSPSSQNHALATSPAPATEQHLIAPLKKPSLAHPPTVGNRAPQPSPTVIETAPSFGNLAGRASSLADEIMGDLYEHGWPRREGGNLPFQVEQMPRGDPQKLQAWMQSRSAFFRFRFFDRVLAMRNEFAQLHIRDENLDEFFNTQGLIEQANKQMAQAASGRSTSIPILPQEIEEVAQRLRILAAQIPVERAGPKPLHFSVDRVAPKDARFPFALVVTITTDEDRIGGYIATEFNGSLATTSTDFIGSKLLFGTLSDDDDETVGNKPLRDYLSAHGQDSYVLEIGSVPFTPSKPIHVRATSNAALNVSRVLFFEK